MWDQKLNALSNVDSCISLWVIDESHKNFRKKERARKKKQITKSKQQNPTWTFRAIFVNILEIN